MRNFLILRKECDICFEKKRINEFIYCNKCKKGMCYFCNIKMLSNYENILYNYQCAFCRNLPDLINLSNHLNIINEKLEKLNDNMSININIKLELNDSNSEIESISDENSENSDLSEIELLERNEEQEENEEQETLIGILESDNYPKDLMINIQNIPFAYYYLIKSNIDDIIIDYFNNIGLRIRNTNYVSL